MPEELPDISYMSELEQLVMEENMIVNVLEVVTTDESGEETIPFKASLSETESGTPIDVDSSGQDPAGCSAGTERVDCGLRSGGSLRYKPAK